MAKVNQDAVAYRNNRWILRYTVVDEDAPGEPALDISNYVIYFSIAPFNTQGDPLVNSPVIDLNSDDDPLQVVKTDAVNGEVEVTLENEDTALLKAPKDYYQELEVEDAFGNRVVSSTGTISVRPNVNNA